jgi:hypothetical protein
MMTSTPAGRFCTHEHWEKARKIGDGNMAEGLRRALDAWS